MSDKNETAEVLQMAAGAIEMALGHLEGVAGVVVVRRKLIEARERLDAKVRRLTDGGTE